MSGWGNFAGGLSQGLMTGMRFNQDQQRLQMQADREERLNEIADLQIQAAQEKAAQEQERKGLETDAAKILADVGKPEPYSVGGMPMASRQDALEAGRQNAQANVRAMDNAMSAFKAGETPRFQPIEPGNEPAMRDTSVSGGGVAKTKAQAFDEMQKAAGKYTHLGMGQAQQIMREQWASKAFETLQRAATLPDRDEALQTLVQTIDAIPDGNRVVGTVDPNTGELTIGYRNEKTGQMVGQPRTYKSTEDFMNSYISALTPEGMQKYFETSVKAQDLNRAAAEKLQAQVDRMERSQGDKIELALLRNNLKRGGAAGAGGAGGVGGGGSYEGGIDFKNEKDISDFMQHIIPDGYIEPPVKNAQGDDVQVDTNALRTATRRNLEALVAQNGGRGPTELAVIAKARALAELSGVEPEQGAGALHIEQAEDGRLKLFASGQDGRLYPLGQATDQQAKQAGMTPQAIQAAKRIQLSTAMRPFQKAEGDPAARAELVRRMGGEANYQKTRDELIAAWEANKAPEEPAFSISKHGPAPETGLFRDKDGNIQLMQPFYDAASAVGRTRKRMQDEVNQSGDLFAP